MVTDKLTLSLLSRLADAQLALATSMKGVTAGMGYPAQSLNRITAGMGYPAQSLNRISEALEVIEAALVEIGRFSSGSNSDSHAKLH